MVLKNQLHPQPLRQIGKPPPKNLGILLDDTGKRDDINHSPQPLCPGMRQGEGQRGQRLAPACWTGQREESRGVARSSQTGFPNHAPLLIHESICRTGLQRIQLSRQSHTHLLQNIRRITRPMLGCFWVHESFSSQKIGIDQTGKQEPKMQRQTKDARSLPRKSRRR